MKKTNKKQVNKKFNNKIVVVDFSGTLIKPFVAEEANLKRYSILNIPKPSKTEHKKMHGTKKHYNVIKNYVEKKLGINDNMNVSFVQNFGKEINISGKHIKTMIMTDLFRDCMYFVTNKYKKKIFAEGIINSLKKIQKKGYKLAIVSGIRTDIITGMLAIAKCPIKFDYIYGQDPVLSRDSNSFLIKDLKKQGKIEFIIGDKLSDLMPAKDVNTKSIFLKGGHPTGKEEAFADFTINKAKELDKIIK